MAPPAAALCSLRALCAVAEACAAGGVRHTAPKGRIGRLGAWVAARTGRLNLGASGKQDKLVYLKGGVQAVAIAELLASVVGTELSQSYGL